jgi:hypothetical protein
MKSQQGGTYKMRKAIPLSKRRQKKKIKGRGLRGIDNVEIYLSREPQKNKNMQNRLFVNIRDHFFRPPAVEVFFCLELATSRFA